MNQKLSSHIEVMQQSLNIAKSKFFKKIKREVFDKPYYEDDFKKFELRTVSDNMGMVYYSGEYIGGFTQDVQFLRSTFQLSFNFIPKKKV